MTMAEQYAQSITPKQAMTMAEEYTAQKQNAEEPAIQPTTEPYEIEKYFSGEMAPDEMQRIERMAGTGELQLPKDVTVTEYHDPMLPQGIGYKLERTTSALEKIGGAGEAALALGTGATTGAAGYVGGVLSGLYNALKSGEYGTEQGAELVKKTAEEMAQMGTYEPRTETGKEYAEKAVEAMAPLEAIAPLAGEIGAATRAAKPVISSAIKKVTTPISEEIDLIRSAIPETEKVRKLKTMASENPTNKELAKYKVVKTNIGEKVVSDSQAKEAIKQGFEDRVISTIKASSPEDKRRMTQMLNIHKSGKKSAKFAAKYRPADVLGKSFDERIKFIIKAKKDAVQELDNAASSLKGKQVDYDPAVNNFMKSLQDIGVSIDEKAGKLNISLAGSDIEGDVASRQLLNRVFNRLVNTKVPDAYDVHRAKRYIDTQVSYGKTKANPLSKTTENIVKSLRRDLNEALRDKSEVYKLANEKYSDSISALDDIQNAVGTKIDLEGQNVDKALGTASRKLLSNYGSRVNMIDAIDKLETTAKKYGASIDNDLVNQIIFANEVDRMFGAPAATSFKGQIEQAVSRGTDMARRGKVDAAIDLAAKGIEKARGINEENAIKSMEEILKRKD